MSVSCVCAQTRRNCMCDASWEGMSGYTRWWRFSFCCRRNLSLEAARPLCCRALDIPPCTTPPLGNRDAATGGGRGGAGGACVHPYETRPHGLGFPACFVNMTAVCERSVARASPASAEHEQANKRNPLVTCRGHGHGALIKGGARMHAARKKPRLFRGIGGVCCDTLWSTCL